MIKIIKIIIEVICILIMAGGVFTIVIKAQQFMNKQIERCNFIAKLQCTKCGTEIEKTILYITSKEFKRAPRKQLQVTKRRVKITPIPIDIYVQIPIKSQHKLQCTCCDKKTYFDFLNIDEYTELTIPIMIKTAIGLIIVISIFMVGIGVLFDIVDALLKLF